MRGAQSERALQKWAAWKMAFINAKGKTIFEVYGCLRNWWNAHLTEEAVYENRNF
jgi:hypothetical protein